MRHLFNDLRLYERMREIDPTLPPVDYVFRRMGKKIPVEQCKFLPENVRQNFHRDLESRAATEPEYVIPAVLMEVSGLRTSESAGTYPQEIKDFGDWGMLAVLWQEKDGKRDDILKTYNSYRVVPLNYWAMKLIRRCMEYLPEVDYESGNTLCTANKLSAWIEQRLRDCGLNDSFLENSRRLMYLFPDHNIDGTVSYDLMAYILRRDAATRMVNYCGFTPVEVDSVLGHVQKGSDSKNMMPEFKTKEQLEPLARKLEHYVMITEKGTSRHPALEPIRVTTGQTYSVSPFDKMIVELDISEETDLEMDFAACEPGEVIHTVTDIGVDIVSRSIDNGYNGRNGKVVHNCIIIGSNLKEENHATA